ncbi:MAG: LPP20 family lipoprotein [Bacteroidales bacterium]|nr:LPP20 family lipoprotein [Bacteroidales bacterium]
MIKHFIFISIIILLSACGASKLAKQRALEMEAAPSWVKSRPTTSIYYVGIGKVSKLSDPEDYQAIAKRAALNDLASEISVNIQSNSLMSSYEDNAGYKSEFTRYIQMEMTKDLAGYQMQADFETQDQYMIYYRLSKVKWAEIQAKRKADAASKAENLFLQGQKEKQELNYAAAIKSYLNSLLELKKYWNEAVYYNVNDEKRRLDLDIRQKLTETLADIQLVVKSAKIDINFQNHFKNNLQIEVVNSKGQLLKNFPIKISYRKVSIPFQTEIYSSKQTLNLVIENVMYKPNSMYVIIEIQKNKALPIKIENKWFLKFVNDAFQVNPIEVPINYLLPKIYIDDQNNQSTYYHYLKDAIQQSFAKQHYGLVFSKETADLIFNIKSHESVSNTDSQVKTANLSYSIEVKNQKKNKLVYTFSSETYKGVAYTAESAKEKAYIKASEDVNDNSFKKLLQEIRK